MSSSVSCPWSCTISSRQTSSTLRISSVPAFTNTPTGRILASSILRSSSACSGEMYRFLEGSKIKPVYSGSCSLTACTSDKVRRPQIFIFTGPFADLIPTSCSFSHVSPRSRFSSSFGLPARISCSPTRTAFTPFCRRISTSSGVRIPDSATKMVPAGAQERSRMLL